MLATALIPNMFLSVGNDFRTTSQIMNS